MNHTAQDVLGAEKRKNFPYPFDIDDATKVLNASSERLKVGRCYFTWDDINGILTINCQKKLKLTSDHPADVRNLGQKIKNMKNSDSAPKEVQKPRTPKPR